MALTLKETNVKINETFNEMLEDLQGNILKHHGREVAYHIFLRFKPEKVQQVKVWIRFFSNRISTAKKQLLDAQKRDVDNQFDGGTFYGLSLSFHGYEKLNIDEMLIPRNPQFRAGMQASRTRLSDDASKWDKELKSKIDAMILVSDSVMTKAESEHSKIVNELTPLCEMVHVQRGEILRNEHGIGIEHFGYVDGVSQPIFLEEEIARQSANSVWNDTATLDLALVKDKGGLFPDSYGSYLVFRKLDQNVLKFKEKEEAISEAFNSKRGILDRYGIPNGELAGAMLVGRFEDGSEVIHDSAERGITDEGLLNNDFDYRSDSSGKRCPLHAHIRITNPRVGHPDPILVRKVRLVRRGMPYNDVDRDVKDLEHDRPAGGVGLLFMCYQADIGAQFEFIQEFWANKGLTSSPVGKDPIIGQGINGEPRSLPNQWDTSIGLQNVNTFQDFVTNKGGEYFFTPSLSFLRNIPIP